MKTVCLDFETFDPWIKQGRGSGWPKGEAKFLCACTLDDEGNERVFRDSDLLCQYLKGFEAIVAHNATYEAGILWSLGFPVTDVKFICTRVLAILYNNDLMDYSLDSLSKRYLGLGKEDDLLGDEARRQGFVKTRVQNANRIAKEHMEEIYKAVPEIVERYCQTDVRLTQLLQTFLVKGRPDLVDTVDFHSDLIKALTFSRARGVVVDLQEAVRLYNKFLPEYYLAREVIEIIAPGLNTSSPKQLIKFFEAEGIVFTRFNKTTNSPKVDTEFLAGLDHPLAKAILQEKKLKKLLTNYIEPVLDLGRPDYPQVSLEYDVDITFPATIKVYPEVKIYGAAATGRASCNSPNLQQIPKRTEEGAQIRRMYKPFRGEQWYSIDFSAQEIRMIVHYGVWTRCEGAQEIATKYVNSPDYDMHQAVSEALKLAEVFGVEAKQARTYAKTINLGLAYGMSTQRLAAILGIPFGKAAFLKDKVRALVPFLAELDYQCKYVIKDKGYIKTIGGRRLRNEAQGERKATNKVVQGSSADQTWQAIVDCYRAGIIILFPIHDSLEFSAKSPLIALEVQRHMEKGTKLLVPSATEMESGPSWGELTKGIDYEGLRAVSN